MSVKCLGWSRGIFRGPTLGWEGPLVLACLQVRPRPCERQVQLFAKGHSNQPNRRKETTSPGSARREDDLGLFECRSKTALFSLFL